MSSRSAQPGLRYGRIIWAVITDRRGSRKERPAIIITPTERITPGELLLVMAVTTTYPEPPPPWHVELPWYPDPRRVGTRLGQRSAAVVEWLNKISPEDVLELKGDVPQKVMREIERQLQMRAGQQ